MKIRQHRLSLSQLPVDLFADPDGTWSYEELVVAAGFDPEAAPPPLVAALSEAWCDHPEGSAVIAGSMDDEAYVVIIETGEAVTRAA
jgi:hypothetical protein